MPGAGGPIWRCLTALLAASILAVLPATSVRARAHPLGNFTVNRYSRVEVGSDRVRIRYVLDLAEIPSVQEAQLADLNHDGLVSDAEWNIYTAHTVNELRANLTLIVDGSPVELVTQETNLSTPAGQANIPLIRIEAWFRGSWIQSTGDTRVHSATFQDRNQPARLGWREIVVQSEAGMLLSQSTVPSADTTDELRSYPERFLQDPLDVRQASWTFTAATANTPSATAARPSVSSGRPADPFTSLVTAADLNLGVVLVALAAAATLGGIHAASPGHGKTVMAAYIVGTRGTFVHALVLGLSVTVAHTFGVLVLGVITLLASNLILPEQLYPWLTLIAAVIILVFGAFLLVGALRGLGRPPQAHLHAHGHDDDGDHHHHHSHTHVPAEAHVHPVQQSLPITWKNLFVLGLAGGIVPSASALVVLLSALALGRLGFGLLLIVAFGLGMAVVLTTTGVLLVYASRFVARYFPDDRQSPLQRLYSRGVPVASAVIMLLIGVIATLQALGQFGILPT
ncbi:MAG: nickel/cobalt transporter [Chloroflexota bacterium]